MSIVEKALNKMRTPAVTEAADAKVDAPAESKIAGESRTGPVAAATAFPAPVSTSAAPAAAPWHARLTSPPVHVDLRALQDGDAALAQANHAEDRFRRIKWPLLEHAIGRESATTPRGQLIMVTSSMPGEGKTFCSINLALSFARQKDATVLLIDGDVRKFDITRRLDVRGRAGLVDLAATEELSLLDVVLPTTIPNFFFLPAGTANSSAPELWAGRRMREVLDALLALDRNLIVVIDSSPVLLTPETQVLSTLVGQLLFVVHADATLQHAVTESLGMLDKAPKTFCLLNQSNEPSDAFYYGYGYGYGYGVSPEGGEKRGAE